MILSCTLLKTDKIILIPKICRSPAPFTTFHNMLLNYTEALLTSLPNTTAGGLPLVRCLRLLIHYIFVVTIHKVVVQERYFNCMKKGCHLRKAMKRMNFTIKISNEHSDRHLSVSVWELLYKAST